MPISRFPVLRPGAARDAQHCSSATGQQRTQFDMPSLSSAQNHQKAAPSRQELYLYPEHDPLE